MPSQVVTEKLEELKSELQKLQSAAVVLQQAADFTRSANKVLEAFPDYLSQMSALQSVHLENLLTNHKKSIGEIESLLNQTVFTTLPDFLEQLGNELNDNFGKNMLKHSNQLTEIAENFNLSVQKTQNNLTTSIAELAVINQNLSTSIDHFSSFEHSYQKFLNEINQINFPTRLEKLDATTAGIMAAVQSVQSRIDLSERNITDQLKNLVDAQKAFELNMKLNLDEMRSSFESNFPSLLEKLDVTNTGIMAAVNSVQSRIDLSERNLTDIVKNSIELQKTFETNVIKQLEYFQSLLEVQLKLQSKKQFTQSIITWILVSASLLTSLYLFLE